MSVKVAINGFGRIGRLILRSLLLSGRKDIEIVRINSRAPAETAAHLFKYDSIFGTYAGEVSAASDAIIIDGKRFAYDRHGSAADCDWRGVDIVMECTGKLKDGEANRVHLSCGAGSVLVAYPCSGADATVVYGVNHAAIEKGMGVISNASCTTNCLVPPLSLLHEAYGVLSGSLVTVHSYTGDQNLVDATHGDLRRARAASCSLVPTSTGAAKNIGLVLPSLSGRLVGSAIRVPTANVSCIDLTVNLGKDVTAAAVNALMREASETSLAGVLAYNEEPLVSVDFIGNSASAIFDSTCTVVVDGRLLRTLSWYDNEWGFSCRMLDVASYMSSVMG